MERKRRSLLSLILVIVVTFALMLTACAASSDVNPQLPGSGITGEYKTAFALSSREDKLLLSSTEAAEKVLPSVVGVLSYETGSSINASSEGSGVIMTSNGYIITNAHVIEGSAMVKIVLSDDTVYTATKGNFWYDTYTDLGLIKVEAEGLIAAEFGKASEIKIAEDVLAIGNPGGLQFRSSVTKGIVSSLNRAYEPVENSGYVINCFQTDAAINPGNSGGALINHYGQVIGINSAKIAAVDYEGIGFAITIDDAQPILSELLSNGYVAGRSAVGVSGRIVTTNVRENAAVAAKSITGLYIDSITNTSLTDNGVGINEIIYEIDGKAVTSSGAISSALKGHISGDIIKMKTYTLVSMGGMGYNSYYNVTSKEISITLIELKP